MVQSLAVNAAEHVMPSRLELSSAVSESRSSRPRPRLVSILAVLGTSEAQVFLGLPKRFLSLRYVSARRPHFSDVKLCRQRHLEASNC